MAWCWWLSWMARRGCIPPSSLARSAASTSRCSSRDLSPSTAFTALARSAMGWAVSTTSIQPRSSLTGRSRYWKAGLVRDLPRKTQNLILYGPEPGEKKRGGFLGVFAYLRQAMEESSSETYRQWLLDHMSASRCPACNGKRLRPESLAVKVNGISIADFTALPVSRAEGAAAKIKLNESEQKIAGRILREVIERLQFLNAVGLGYISLDRSAMTLSGGEGQRIRLATQIGSKLRGVLYVLDEPSIGLHHRDNERLLAALE